MDRIASDSFLNSADSDSENRRESATSRTLSEEMRERFLSESRASERTRRRAEIRA